MLPTLRPLKVVAPAVRRAAEVRTDPGEAWVAADRAAARARLVAVTALTLAAVAVSLVGIAWLPLVLAAPVVVWAAAPVHRRAWDDLRRATPSVDLAASLAIVASFPWSTAVSVVLAWLAVATNPPTQPVRKRRDARGLPAGWQPRRVVAPEERAVSVLVPLTLVVAAASSGFWLAAGAPLPVAAATATSVLLLAGPSGLLLARRVDGEAAALAAQVDTVVLRRTGVLTTGQPWLVDVALAADADPDHILWLVGSLARRSPHPVAHAVVAAAERRGLPLAEVELLVDRPGLGVRGVVDGTIVVAGRERFVTAWARELPEHLATARTAAETAGQIALLVGWDDAVRAVLVVGDPPRPTAADAVAALTALGIEPVLACGDDRLAATAMADAVGVTKVVPLVLPEATAGVVAQLRQDGRIVATAASERDTPADVLVEPDLWAAVDALSRARVVTRLTRQNVALAVGLNLAALPLAVLGRLGPTPALVLAVVSAAAVGLNGLRIRRLGSVRPPAHRLAR